MRITSWGSDIEWFMVDTQHYMVPAYKFLPTTKGDTSKMVDIGGGFHIFADGSAVEMNTPAFADPHAFVNETYHAFRRACSYLSERNPQLRASQSPSKQLPREYREEPEALVFGCMPDDNAYTGEQRTLQPKDMINNNRYCAGHIHMGLDVSVDEARRQAPALTVACDLRLKSYAREFFPDHTYALGEQSRDNVYGKHGHYRFKPEYPGIEYRSMSSCWVMLPSLRARFGDRLAAFAEDPLLGFDRLINAGDVPHLHEMLPNTTFINRLMGELHAA